jgi:hypothetical protein
MLYNILLNIKYESKIQISKLLSSNTQTINQLRFLRAGGEKASAN